MSRWSKSRTVPSYALPLDALLKEKENTNRPVAARSAGTVGKWGVTSFTSMRARPVYGFASFSPNQDPSLQYSQFSPKSLIEGGITNAVQTPAESSPVAKPKKFFKSRNSVPDANAIVAALSDSQMAASVMGSPSYYTSPVSMHQQPHAHQLPQPEVYPEKPKRKKAAKSGESPKKVKAEKSPKPEKPPKVEKPPKPPKAEKLPKVSKKKTKAAEKVVADAPKPTRVLSRTRKVVNYSEDQSRSPPRNQPPILPPPEEPATEPFSNDLITSPIHAAEVTNNVYNSNEQLASYQDEYPGDSPSKNCGPPIKLRISKGTSRLISTDSEGISGSPPYLSPTQPQTVTNSQQYQQSNPNYSAAASLLAVLSDDPVGQQTKSPGYTANESQIELNAASTKPKKEKAKPKAEPIKLKIKTNARLRNNSELEANEESEVYRGRSTRRTPQHSTAPVEENVPELGTPNYDLYRTLTESPTKPFESQPHFEPSHISPEYQHFASPHLTQATVPQLSPEFDAQNTHSDTERGILPKKRRGRNKAKFEANIDTVPEEPTQKKQRGRRKQDDPLPEVTEPIQQQTDFLDIPPENPAVVEEISDNYPKKRITAAAKKQYKDEQEFPIEPIQSPSPVDEAPPQIDENNSEPASNKRGRKGKGKANPVEQMSQPEVAQRPTRATRHNANGNMTREKDQIAEPVAAAPTRSYGRKRKIATEEAAEPVPIQPIAQLSSDTLTLPQSENNSDLNAINMNTPFDDSPNDAYDEQKKMRNRTKRQNQNQYNGSHDQQKSSNNNDTSASFEIDQPEKIEENFEKPVKLVISKKKGSIFKSRAIEADTGESNKQKRHVYKHTWDDDLPDDQQASTHDVKNNPPSDTFEADFDMDDGPAALGTLSGSNSSTLSKFTRAARSNVPDDDVRISNVKKAHQMQEIGEFQEMDDDVEYILDALKSQNPIATRSLAAIQLAFKCMTPAFRMHVRAHGTATKFFSALHDATQNQSLGLCTAAIMFVLIQDNLNMDLDKHSLELMLNLLDSDISQQNNFKETGLTDEQSQRNEQKVIEICRDIKSQGKAAHLNLDNISIGTLAMETLLTLTSKRAGEWFKDEMRKLGGLEHIINTICECCKQISEYVIEWTEPLLEKLRKIERCMRVLENLSERNEDNQKYILHYKDGEVVETLGKFYKLCNCEIALYPTSDASPAGEPGVVLREALVPTLKVLINLTHNFNKQPLGSALFGAKPIIFNTCLQLLLEAHQYIPESCVFELSLLVLLLLINLISHSVENRKIFMETIAPDTNNQHEKVPAIRAIINYFYKYEEMARLVEQNTDDILDNPEKTDKNKYKSQEDVEETVSKLLQKAGNHMEHTFLASYVCLLIGNLIMENKQHENDVRKMLRNHTFVDMVQILDKYYNFLNLTASSEAIHVNHMKETKQIIQFMKDCELHPKDVDATHGDDSMDSAPHTSHAHHSAAAPSTYSSSSGENRWASNTSSSSNSLFNKLYDSGR